jgi:zinc D-Ala-D-Ala dipeptidase
MSLRTSRHALPDNRADRDGMDVMRVIPIALLMLALALASCSARPAAAPRAAPALVDATTLGAPEIDRLLEADRNATGEPILWPVAARPLVTAQAVTIRPGQTTGWHRHAVPTFGHILSGTLEVEYAGVTGRRTLAAGDSLMESMRVDHNATNLGTEPVRILVVFMGAQGKPTTVKTDAPPMPAGLGGNRAADLVDLRSVDPDVRIDLRYAGANNFTGAPIYTNARALMQRPAAEALARVDRRARDRGYGLLVLDAYRPWSVTRQFWDRFPMHRAYLADPLEGSRHNRGCAVDLTLVDLASGVEVEMPSAYDDFSERSHPQYTGGTAVERRSRDLLRSLMEAEGFTVYENEWWHFDYRNWREWPVLDVPFETAVSTRHASRR